ncbi:MAG: hypothetical protein EXS36_16065 [Pedosphaera sp.]|nr:hypothetical protein [Pedosphaera sp.]
MAWRIHDSVVQGVIDNRVRGSVTGQLWLVGRAAPLQLRLRGNACGDLAGCELSFERVQPDTLIATSLAMIQEGVVGEMTASRKARVQPAPSSKPGGAGVPAERIRPYRLANVLFLEWYSERNGRVVLESPDFNMHVSDHAWSLSAMEEEEQRRANAAALREFMRRLAE